MHIIRKITDEFWWNVARKCSYATFYHTPIWKEFAERSFPGLYRDETFGAILPNGVRVVFPMISTRRLGPFRSMISTFEGCYGGFIADGPVSPEEAAQIYKYVCTYSTYSFYILDNPLGQPLPDTIKPKFRLMFNEVTYTVHLDADFDTIFSRFQRTQRKDYRRGLKRGVQVRAANSLDDYHAYFLIYLDAIDRWGKEASKRYDWFLFEQCYYLSQIYPENIKLWVMTFDEKVVGGSIVFYWGQQATAWNGTAHRDFLDYEVMPVGDTEMIRDAITRGFRYFDFNTSSLDEGVMMYKQRFGAESIPINIWRFENPLLKPIRQTYLKMLKRSSDEDLVKPAAGLEVLNKAPDPS